MGFLAQNLFLRPTVQTPRLLFIFVCLPPTGKQVLSYFPEGSVICTIWQKLFEKLMPFDLVIPLLRVSSTTVRVHHVK